MGRAGILLLLAALLYCAGCPGQPAPPEPDRSIPTTVLPVRGRLLSYDKLTLGMDALKLAQLYNAPEGKGEGFQRLVQDFDGVQHHIIQFDEQPGQARRRLVLALLRDELYQVVDRRDGLTTKQAAEWKGALVKLYGKPDSEPVAGAQWSWGPENEVLLTYTQDNASDHAMSANVVLVFKPYEEAAYNYLADWQKAHPDYKPEESQF